MICKSATELIDELKAREQAFVGTHPQWPEPVARSVLNLRLDIEELDSMADGLEMVGDSLYERDPHGLSQVVYAKCAHLHETALMIRHHLRAIEDEIASPREKAIS